MRRCGGEILFWARIVGRWTGVAVVQRLESGERRFWRIGGGLSSLFWRPAALPSWSWSSLSCVKVLELGDGVGSESFSSLWRREILGWGVMEGGEKVCAAEDGAMKQQEPGKCWSWLPKKRRFCASHALPGLQYVTFFGLQCGSVLVRV